MQIYILRIRIYLLELQGDYLQSFRLNMQDESLKSCIFTWIEDKFEKLSLKEVKVEMFTKLKQNVGR